MKVDVYKPFPQTVTGDDGEVIGYAHKFTNLDELQTAMSILVPLANSQKAAPQWKFIPVGFCDKSDPLGQVGYVALRTKA